MVMLKANTPLIRKKAAFFSLLEEEMVSLTSHLIK
jgi:hypothetical protein